MSDTASIAPPPSVRDLVLEFEVQIPQDYVHRTYLGSSIKNAQKRFSDVSPSITDEHFPRATTILAPGQRFKVKIYGLAANSELITSCLDFMETSRATFVGPRGLNLLVAQDQYFEKFFHRKRIYVSLDKKEMLWKEMHRGSRNETIWFPYLNGLTARRKRTFDYLLTTFKDNEGGLLKATHLVCFYEISEPEG